MGPDLPLDVHLCILDHLWDDKLTLSNCALVCHAWLHTARIHLFDTVCVTAEVLDSFLVFLDSQSEVLPHIKTLHMLYRRGVRGRLSWPELNIEDLTMILSHLSGLHTLHLQYMYLRGWHDGASLVRSRRFHLDTLWIDDCSRALHHQDSLLDIMDFICLFESIGTLTFVMQYWVSRISFDNWHPPHTVEIEQLSVKVNDLWWDEASTMLGKLIRRSPGPQTLSFFCGRLWSDVCATGSLLAVAGTAHLRHLTLNFSRIYLRQPPSTAQVTGALSFANFTDLEYLHFVIYLEDFLEEMGQSWTCSRMCADMLSTATRLRALTTLILTIDVPNDVPAALNQHAIDWGHLNAMIGSLDALRRVNVTFRCPIREATIADGRAARIVRQGLSVPASNGMLEVNIEYGCEDMLD